MMRVSDFHYELPHDLIAQHPAAGRDQSRLLVLNRASHQLLHRRFSGLGEFLRPGDLLVLNDSRVLPARLFGTKSETGGEVELLLVEEVQANDWWALVRPGKRVRVGTTISLLDRQGNSAEVQAAVREKNSEGHCRVEFQGCANILERLEEIGALPLPPYIERSREAENTEDQRRYQTVFARHPGSVAAPTAGLHFTQELLAALRAYGVEICTVTLHVGLGTFAPVKASRVEEHNMHEERFSVSEPSAAAIQKTRRQGGRVIAVGTTSLRVLESAAAKYGPEFGAVSDRTRLFIYPPYSFQMAGALITNFHLPESTLLMLVSAFVSPGQTDGREILLRTYHQAIEEKYRFFSYGDAMLII